MNDKHWVLFSQECRESPSENETWWMMKKWENVQSTGNRIMVACLENRKVA